MLFPSRATASISFTKASCVSSAAALAADGIAVFHAQKHVETLEEMFLQATGGESVD